MRCIGVKTLLGVMLLAGCANAPVRSRPAADVAEPAQVQAQAQALDQDTSCHIPGFRDKVIRQVNAARATAQRCGALAMAPAPPLAWNDALFVAAVRHSRDMAQRDYFGHASPEGNQVAQRATAAGYAWRTVGENLAGGDRTVDAVMDGWMRSPTHCHNVMQPEFVDVAVACVQRNGTTWGTYWTMVLGRRR